ncbi:helix-turn-helix transcriptional regulator [Aerococcaceae bacterium DSM 111021]|nr:helix-turn-helix transcriptional regulator [Aerococcaceae bacterium DSM 111021]
MDREKIIQNISESMLIGRKRKKWTQKQCADAIGISRTYYSDIENGRTLPSFNVLLKINQLFPFFLINKDADSERVM